PEHPPSPDYVLGLEYPEYVVPFDDEISIEDQPLPADASPTTLSPGYVADSDTLKKDPEEEPEEDPVDYPADGGDNDDDDEEEEEEEHLAPTDSTTLPAIDPVLSAEDTEAFEMDEEDVSEADMLPLKMLCLITLTPRFEAWESSAVAVTRQPGLDVTHAADYSFIDTVDATPECPMSIEVGYRITDV
nr:hypothetical protein [Tanacetum cinerariifolium]